MSIEYSNTLSISGDPTEIQSFANKCKGWDRYYPNSNDDYTREIEAFKNEISSAKRKAYYRIMPRREAQMKALAETREEIERKFRPRTEEEIQNAIEINRQKHFAKEPYFCLNVLHPEPESNHGRDNWKDWRFKNWGCKWALTYEFEESDDNIRISLVAASGYIAPWVYKVSRDFPALTFYLEWDGDGLFAAGTCTIQNGEILQWFDERG